MYKVDTTTLFKLVENNYLLLWRNFLYLHFFKNGGKELINELIFFVICNSLQITCLMFSK